MAGVGETEKFARGKSGCWPHYGREAKDALGQSWGDGAMGVIRGGGEREALRGENRRRGKGGGSVDRQGRRGTGERRKKGFAGSKGLWARVGLDNALKQKKANQLHGHGYDRGLTQSGVKMGAQDATPVFRVIKREARQRKKKCWGARKGGQKRGKEGYFVWTERVRIWSGDERGNQCSGQPSACRSPTATETL